MEPKSPVYIGIPEHVEIRKALLLSSKDILSSLKAYESIKELKAQRTELTFELHRAMDEVSVLVKKTRINLPKPPQQIDLGGRGAAEDETDEKNTKRTRKAAEDKLSALDSELGKVEARLKRLK